jgi:hypothetical protein
MGSVRDGHLDLENRWGVWVLGTVLGYHGPIYVGPDRSALVNQVLVVTSPRNQYIISAETDGGSGRSFSILHALSRPL